MDSSKTTVGLPNESVVDEVATQIALNTFLHQTTPYKDIFSDTYLMDSSGGNRINFIEVKEHYKRELLKNKGKSTDVPSESEKYLNPYPYLNQSSLKDAGDLIKRQFPNSSEDELSENDLKVQSLLSFRQYLRIIRRLLALTYFHSHQNDEFPTVSHGEIKHKYFEPKMLDSVAARMGAYMHIHHYYKHILNRSAPA